MSRYGRYGGETKVYVGNLGTGAGKGELERAFSYYGPLRTVWIARNPPGFAFVEFEDPRDAEDAVRGLDGKVICGSRVRVELSTGMPQEEGILAHAAEVVGEDPDRGQGPDPGLLHGQEAGRGPVVDLNLAHLLKADQNPDQHLQREAVHHQEPLEGVQVRKELIKITKLTL
ncbi:serine/arginine-rich splicing factor 7 [Alligator mississippiensis]|uniref:Serine/arginine-rich splicing factor 7 n=1 Tax=Alligator mississippiensis TaxID=8496 RepID=A0A151M1Q9_ALLMI|nr:serine/arginine-rich splicing factor 7 [Alligator mississippiensis]